MRICLLAGLLIASAFAESPVTYYKDVAPITNANCASCHRPGQAGPFSLLTFEDAKRRASQIAAVTRSRYMPPWLPEPGYGKFGDEHRLSDAQIKTLSDWVRAGAPAGDPADAPPTPKFSAGWQLGEPDLVVTAPKPFVMRADGPDQFWNFVLAVPVDSTRFVRAVEIRPGNARIVHHANLLIDRARSSRRREKAPGLGFEGMDLQIESETFDPDSHFLFWKPGSAPEMESSGMAWRLDPGTDLVLNVHLQTTGKPESVQPSVGLYFTSEPQTKFPMLIQLENDGALDIPPGAKDFVVEDQLRLPCDVDVLGVYPHAHYLGTLLEAWAVLPDGHREWLIRIPDWDLNWQAVYRYAAPVFLPRNSVIHMKYRYDNSDGNPRNPSHPPKRVKGGNQATDEMGHLWLQVLPHGGAADRPVLQEALMRRRLEKYPADFSAHFNLGALLLSAGKPSEAVLFFQDALRAEPSQPAALNALGSALMAQGKETEARPYFERCLQAEPGYSMARYNLANSLADAGRFEEAVQDFRRAAAEMPNDKVVLEHYSAALDALAESQVAGGQFESAAITLKEALRLQPRDSALHNRRGAILLRMGRRDEARGEFESALSLDPGNEEARRNLAGNRPQQAVKP